ncbi:MAG: hypothetical protein AAF998_15975 [Bacteroidota bacterium]
MERNEIELIVLSVGLPNEPAIFIKAYKEGTLVRNGAGGFPGVRTSALAVEADESVFARLITQVPDQVLQENLFLRADNVAEGTQLISYTIGFYGVSANDEHGERADWQKTLGMNVSFDPSNPVDSPLLPYMDGLVTLAARLTNSWYFDVMVEAALKMKSNELPPQTMISLSPDAEEVRKDFGNYLQQVRMNSRGQSLNELAAGKSYQGERPGTFALSFEEHPDRTSYQFTPIPIG